jgi:hypothetical protein
VTLNGKPSTYKKYKASISTAGSEDTPDLGSATPESSSVTSFPSAGEVATTVSTETTSSHGVMAVASFMAIVMAAFAA